MKNITTRFEYRVVKGEQYDRAEGTYFNSYRRSYDMVVTAGTAEECRKIMDSFEEYASAKDLQDSFDSSIEPEFNSLKNKWIGSVEIYISNTDVTEEKAVAKQIYKTWKESLKEKVEVKMQREEIKIDNIMETSYEDGTSWVTYKTPAGAIGYLITEEHESGDEELLEKEINSAEFQWAYNQMLDKKDINSISIELAELIEECRCSENEMWFVEQDDEMEGYMMTALAYEVHELGLDDYVKFNEGGCKITVYGGIITQFLFSPAPKGVIRKSHEVVELTGYDKFLQATKSDLEKITREVFEMSLEEFLGQYTHDDVDTIQRELYVDETEEYCPYCNETVTLNAELSIQTCPSCLRKIATCSMCIKQNCYNCPFKGSDYSKGEEEKIFEVHQLPIDFSMPQDIELESFMEKIFSKVYSLANKKDIEVISVPESYYLHDDEEREGFGVHQLGIDFKIPKAFDIEEFMKYIYANVCALAEESNVEVVSGSWSTYLCDYED